jgi:hypothetical protein
MAIWYIIRPLGIFYGHLVYYKAIWYIVFTIWYIVPRWIWQPCSASATYCHGQTFIASDNLNHWKIRCRLSQQSEKRMKFGFFWKLRCKTMTSNVHMKLPVRHLLSNTLQGRQLTVLQTTLASQWHYFALVLHFYCNHIISRLNTHTYIHTHIHIKSSLQYMYQCRSI